MPRIMIVDGMSVMKTSSGPMSALVNGYAYNFFQQLTSALKKFPDVTQVVVTWEGGFEHRTKIFPEYKSSRKGSNSEFVQQRDIVKGALHMLGIDQCHAPGHEGDDVGAWLTHNLGTNCLLFSNDQDWLQLVRPGISIYQKSKYSSPKPNQRVEITDVNFERYTGWPSPQLYLTAKCIMGDKDEIPGLEGVGDTTTRSFLLGMPLAESKKNKISAFVESQEFARNMLLGDLITPKNLRVVWTMGSSEPDETTVKDWLLEIGWFSITNKFDPWWTVYKGIQS